MSKKLNFHKLIISILIVETNSGWVRGVVDSTTRLFKGIPFAQPPLGQLRFKRPVPIGKWEGVKDATKFANDCLNVLSYVNNTSEDW